MRTIIGVLAAVMVLGCAPSPDRYTVVSPDISETQRIAFSSVEVRNVSLPAYAASDEITVQDADGRLVSDGSVLWADTPDRAVAQELSRNLSRITGARVAASPWPLETLPAARLEVRFETLLAGADGQYRAQGQYFVAVPEGGRERFGLFDLAVPYDLEAGAGAIAAARGQLILDLSRDIARRGLR